MGSMLNTYNKCTKLPLGKGIFSRLVCIQAPYFGSIRPRFEELRPGYCRIGMKKRRSITNHIKSVHAIAMCNLAELAAGTMVEASIGRGMRWIPKGMSVKYQKIAKTDLTASCEIALDRLDIPGDCPIDVNVTDRDGQVVFTAQIAMYLSAKK
jgi:acyl-coenzyme A thioesterase PaaI-like protein